MLTVVLVFANRIYVRLWFVETVQQLSSSPLPPKRMIAELKQIVVIADQYQWLK